MEKFLVVANWKANPPVKYDFSVPENLEIAIAAPFLFISQIPPDFTRAAQDISAYPVGAYTGEAPGELLADLGVKYCLVGHSERRKYLHEGSVEVEAKMSQAIKNGLIPILCAQNLEEIPENIRNFSEDKYVIMYEPFAAISTAGQYHPESNDKILTVISDWKNKLNLHCRFLYGGSINPESDIPQVDGLVVGHASLDMATFSAIIKKCSRD